MSSTFSHSSDELMLTKSNYLSAHQCQKRIWLEKKSDLQTSPLSKSELKRIREGNRVGEAARVTRGDGILIESLNWKEALATTKNAIESGAERIFEAAFCFKDYAVRLDIIEKTKDSWNLYEVKASTSLKPEHITDVSFQKYVAEQSGLVINDSSIVLLNKNYTERSGEELFVYENVDQQIKDYLVGLEAELVQINKVLESDRCPAVHVSRHCKKPEKCSYYEHCWKDIPEKSIFSIPRLNAKKEDDFELNSYRSTSTCPIRDHISKAIF